MKELSLSEKKQLFNSIDSLYSAGFSYSEIFASIESSSLNTNITQLVYSLRVGLENGIPIQNLMMKYKDIISPQYAMLFCAGDESGKLEETISCIRKDLLRTENLKNSIISSLTYPALLFLGAIGVLIFCNSFFFPIFASMYSGGICPASVNILLITAILKILAVYAGIFAGIFVVIKNKNLYQKAMDFLVEHTFFSSIINGIYYNNFFSVLAAFYEAGIPITEAVESASTLFKTKKTILGMYKTSAVLKKGSDVTSAFLTAQIFNNFDLSQIATGEKTGRLSESFKNIANEYEKNLQSKLNVITSLIQPVSIVVMGLVVGYIAITFYSKLYGGLLNSL